MTFDPFLLEASPVFSPCLTLPEVNKLSSDSRFSDNREMTNSTQNISTYFYLFLLLDMEIFFVSFIQPSNKLIDSLEFQVEALAVLLFCLWSDRGEAADSLSPTATGLTIAEVSPSTDAPAGWEKKEEAEDDSITFLVSSLPRAKVTLKGVRQASALPTSRPPASER